MISLIASIAASLFSMALHVKGLGNEKKKDLSTFFTEIADTLDEAITKFKADEVPHGSCARMRHYAFELPKILDGVVDKEVAFRYSYDLERAHQIETLLIELRDDPTAMTKLEIAAGNFRAIGTVFKVKN